jgi:hypothetical protein
VPTRRLRGAQTELLGVVPGRSLDGAQRRRRLFGTHRSAATRRKSRPAASIFLGGSASAPTAGVETGLPEWATRLIAAECDAMALRMPSGDREELHCA